jgi:acyl carrier protein
MASAEIEAVILKELSKTVRENADANGDVSLDANTNIARELGLDSLAIMDLVMALEDHFDISIPLDRIAETETVNELADLVNSLKTEVEA